MKLAELLNYRKQVAQKVDQLKPIIHIGEQGLFEIKTQRKNISESVDEVSFQIPKVTIEDVTRTFDFWASELRKVDNMIQQTNWTTEINFTVGVVPNSEAKVGK